MTVRVTSTRGTGATTPSSIHLRSFFMDRQPVGPPRQQIRPFSMLLVFRKSLLSKLYIYRNTSDHGVCHDVASVGECRHRKDTLSEQLDTQFYRWNASLSVTLWSVNISICRAIGRSFPRCSSRGALLFGALLLDNTSNNVGRNKEGIISLDYRYSIVNLDTRGTVGTRKPRK